ncbi:MAG: hypothetical protein JWM20_586 [Patescibacteria group bacterium]|nr:hypothetical protein [Patescibacteria group bacterium]
MENKAGKSPVKEGAGFAFEQSPELRRIGTQEQYGKYLETIFPKSAVQNIVWHATNNTFDAFDKKYIGSSTDQGSYGKGFYMSDRQRNFGERALPVMVDLKNPITTDPVKFYEEKNNKPDFSDIEAYENYKGNYVYPTPELITALLVKNGFDGVAFQPEPEPGSHVEYVVFEPEQAHIIGSKPDLEKFRKFVESPNI